jgi:outer membrane immunogenic protein
MITIPKKSSGMASCGNYAREEHARVLLTCNGFPLPHWGCDMKRIWTGILVAASLSVPALAADLGRPYQAPPPAPVANWTGFYVGINGGGGILNGDIMDPECWTCASTSLHAGFGTFGGQIGYNWQINTFVLGLEGDMNWASADQSTGYALDDGNSSGTATLKMDAFGSVRGRAGLAVGPTLLYVTAGPAWGHFNSSVVLGNQAIPPVVRGTASDDEWRLGLAAGGGVEYMLTNNWTIRGEYLFLDFLDAQQTMNFVNPNTTCSFNVPCKETFANTASVARVGLNYKF